MFGKISRHEVIYLMLLAVWAIIANMALTRWTHIINVNDTRELLIKALILFTLVSIIVGEARPKSEIVFTIIFLVLSYVVNSNVRGMYGDVVWITGLFLVNAFRVNYKRIMMVYGGCMLLVFIATVAASLAGVFVNKNWDLNGAKYDLGYRYYTYPSYVILFLSLIYIMIRKNIKLYEVIALFVINGIIYRISNTRATIIVMICVVLIAIIFELLLRMGNHMDDRGWYALVGAPWIIMTFSYAVHWFYDESNAAWLRINDILSSRLRLGNMALHKYDHTLLGKFIYWVGIGRANSRGGYNYVDNYYIKYNLTYGLLLQFILMAGLSYVIKKCIDNKRYYSLVAILGILIFGIIDAEMLDIRYNPFVLLIACIPTIEERRNEKI